MRLVFANFVWHFLVDNQRMLEQLQADCLKSQCRITASKARLLQEVKVGYLLDPETKQQSSK
jgi:hypothetical protein